MKSDPSVDNESDKSDGLINELINLNENFNCGAALNLESSENSKDHSSIHLTNANDILSSNGSLNNLEKKKTTVISQSNDSVLNENSTSIQATDENTCNLPRFSERLNKKKIIEQSN